MKGSQLSRKRTAALGAGALSALLAGGIALAPMASATVEDSAYGVAADGLIDIPKTPHVVGSGEASEMSLDLPQHGEVVLSLGVLNAAAEKGWAQASTAELRLGLPGAPVIEATLIEATCDDLSGSTRIVGLTVDGEEMFADGEVPVNEELIPEQLEDIASVTLNKQVENEDGSMTVTAISVDVLSDAQIVGELLGQSLDISSATCTEGGDGGEPTDPPTEEPTESPTTEPSKPDNGDNGDDNGDGDEADENGNAPVPTPQPGHLEVTG